MSLVAKRCAKSGKLSNYAEKLYSQAKTDKDGREGGEEARESEREREIEIERERIDAWGTFAQGWHFAAATTH